MIDIAGWKVSEEDVALAAQIARGYSEYPYEHPYGLCWVMAHENHFARGADIIYAVRQHWAGGVQGALKYVTSYVTREPGPVPERRRFARQLADYLDARLAFPQGDSRIRTIYRVRDDDTGREWDSPYGCEAPGYTILYSSVEFADKVENLGHTYDYLVPEDPPA